MRVVLLVLLDDVLCRRVVDAQQLSRLLNCGTLHLDHLDETGSLALLHLNVSPLLSVAP